MSSPDSHEPNPEPPKRGRGRPRIHKSAAAKQRAYEAKKYTIDELRAATRKRVSDHRARKREKS